jgi:glucosamine--fructose-6-phosphate aminotransferase (isomerizing)
MISKISEEKFNIPSKSLIASEFNSAKQLINKNALYVFISQSGETADTLLALDYVKQNGGTTLALTNARDSTITRKADYTIFTSAGKEIAVASTKAYNCQILAGIILCNYIFSTKSIINSNTDFIEQKLLQSECEIEKLINRNDEQKLASLFKDVKECFFIGRHYDYVTSKEASLKLKEISYINCSAFPSGELKHGTLALIDNNSIVIAICTSKNQKKKIETSLSEVKSRGATTIILSQLEFDHTICDYQITLPNLDEDIINLISIIPMQKLAYYVSLLKGFNPDKPRNLAKSVTVE